MSEALFPFAAVVGQDEAKAALLAAGADPALSGVLLRGERGSAKTTLARSLSGLLPSGTPFVELPLGATEDRVGGSLDITGALSGGELGFRPGLLAAADGGVLYVDEINLLADHLVDMLLDAAASGRHVVERDGLSREHPARFVLIGSMNPEEGELRPQLADRFGLSVDIAGPREPQERAEALRRRLAFDSDPAAFAASWQAEQDRLAASLAAARARSGTGPRGLAARLPEEVLLEASRRCAEAAADGLRADLSLCRAACARAALASREAATMEDVAEMAGLVLRHRMRKSPLDGSGQPAHRGDPPGGSRGGDGQGGRSEPPPGAGATTPSASNPAGSDPHPPSGPGAQGTGREQPAPEGTDRDLTGPAGTDGAPAGGAGASQRGAAEQLGAHALAAGPLLLASEGRQGARGGQAQGRGRGATPQPRGAPGRPVRFGEATDGAALAAGPTALAALSRRAAGGPGSPALLAEDLHKRPRQSRPGRLTVFVVDSSGSMGARRMRSAKLAVLRMLLDAYQRRDQVAVVGFGGQGAQVLLRPTSSVEVAQARLATLPSGGPTPLSGGLCEAAALAQGGAKERETVAVVISDFRPTLSRSGGDPVEEALDAGRRLAAVVGSAVLVDTEEGRARFGIGRRLAEVMGASYLEMADLEPEALERLGAGSV